MVCTGGAKPRKRSQPFGSILTLCLHDPFGFLALQILQMLKFFNTFLIVGGLGAMVSCRPQILDTLDLELPSKLVVGCNLIVESDSLMQADSLYLHLSQSSPLFGNPVEDDSAMANATIQLLRHRTGLAPQAGDTLSDFQITAPSSPFQGGNLVYGTASVFAGQPFIRQGYDYMLRVQSRDGRTVTSSASIPDGSITDTALQILVSSPDEFNRNIQIKVRWRNPNDGPSSPASSYYRINYRIKGVFTNESYWHNASLSGFPNQLVFGSSQEGGVYEWQDRITYSLPFDSAGLANARLEVAIQRINRPLFQYLQAIGQQGLNEGNPFGEPVVIPSNIQGGLGCMGSMVTYRLQRPLPW